MKSNLIAILIALTLITIDHQANAGIFIFRTSPGGSVLEFEQPPLTPDFIDFSVPVTAGTVTIQWDGSGDGVVRFNNSVGFYGSIQDATASGDTLTLDLFEGEGPHLPGYGTIVLNGDTILQSSGLPASLDGFTSGTYEYSPASPADQGYYFEGQAFGTLSSVPEPTSFITLAIGLSGLIWLKARRK